MQVTQQLVRPPRHTFGGINGRRLIAVHETANERPGAGAQEHANLQSRGNVREASWHYSVDDKAIFQSYLDTAQCWHAGDGYGPGNLDSIAIEICVNPDSDYKTAVANGAQLARDLMHEYNIPLGNVKQHNFFSSYGKDCPNHLRDGDWGLDWDDFLDMVTGGVLPAPKPVSGAEFYDVWVDGWWGRETTTALQDILSTPVDGEVWNQYIQWEAQNPGLTSGWKWNDSGVGSPMIRAQQVVMRAAGQYDGRLDGLIGPKHIRGLQERFLGAAVDDVLDGPSRTIKVIQGYINEHGRF